MKLIYYVLSLLLFSYGLMYAESSNELCRTGESCEDASPDSCLCYCAFKPGTREKTRGDKPFIYGDKNVPKRCYCAQRDVDRLKK